MGATGALLMAAARRRLNRDLLQQALDRTVRLTTFVLFILIGSRVFSLTFYGIDGHLWVEHLLLGLPGGATGFLIVVMALVFVLAFFLDFFELAFIVVPLLAPVADKLGIDLVWFGVLLAVNMQTSFMHPPFGFALFFLWRPTTTLPARHHRPDLLGRRALRDHPAGDGRADHRLPRAGLGRHGQQAAVRHHQPGDRGGTAGAAGPGTGSERPVQDARGQRAEAIERPRGRRACGASCSGRRLPPAAGIRAFAAA
jgi:hypothetical protein